MLTLKHIFKSLLKYRLSTGLSLLSLVISFLGIIILVLYVSFEKSFDRYNENYKSIYRLETSAMESNVTAVFADLIRDNIPDIKQLAVFSFFTTTAGLPADTTNIERVNIQSLHTSSNFFEIFSVPLISGKKENILDEPLTTVLTEELSKKLFPNESPLGKSVEINKRTYKIVGVIKNFPENSSFNADAICSIATYYKFNDMAIDSWSEWSFNIYLQLTTGSNSEQIATKIEAIPDISESLQFMKEQFPNQPFFTLVPLQDIHYKVARNYTSINPHLIDVLVLLIGLLIIMGAVNYINFATATAQNKTKSLAVFNVFGARKFSLIKFPVYESIIMTFSALGISLLIFSVIRTPIANVFEISGLNFQDRPVFLLYFVLGAFVFAVLASIYPSKYINSSPIALSLKGKPRFTAKGKIVRSILVILQFTITISLIIAAVLVEKQLRYWRNFDIGINTEHIVYLNASPKLRESSLAFAQELLKHESITDYTYTASVPGSVGMGWGRPIDGKYFEITSWPVDERFFNFFNIEMIEGRKFSSNIKADENTFILNQTAVAKLEWAKPLEKTFPGIDFEGKVIGVAKDFNFSSLKEEVKPMLFWLTSGRKYRLLLRLNPGNVTQTLDYIQQVAQKFDPTQKIEIQFLDESLNRLYKREELIAKFIEFVTMWCVLLALTGILGLVFFIVRDRIKEIGIRKVNGSNSLEVMYLLNKNFMVWITIAFVIACPIVYYIMSLWLQSFAYKTMLSWWIFAIAGLLTFALAMITVSWLTYRAARRNPVESLRYE